MQTAKQRVTYAQFLAARAATPTISMLIERYVEEMSQPMMKPIGESALCQYRVIQRADIAAVPAAGLKATHVLDFCRARRANLIPTYMHRSRANGLKEVAKPTVKKDLAALRVVMRYASEVWEVECNVAGLKKGMREAERQGLIADSIPRKRRPQLDEIDRLLELHEREDANPKAVCKMAPLTAASIISSRRLGELCRITHGDLDWTKGTYWVRDMKHPTQKKGNDKEFPMFAEFAEIIRRQPRVDPNDPTERVFPYKAKTASSRGTLARKKLCIVGLRFHDNRREAITRWLKKLGPHKTKTFVSGHDDMRTLLKHYDAPEATDLLQEFGAELMQPKPIDTRAAA